MLDYLSSSIFVHIKEHLPVQVALGNKTEHIDFRALQKV